MTIQEGTRNMTETQTISTLCRMCDHGCGIDVRVEDGNPINVKGRKDHPFNRGWLCAKGRAALDLFYSPQRLRTPLIRKDGTTREANWDEALTLAAEKLHGLRDRYGAQSLAVYYGEGVGHQEIRSYIKRFANVYGTPNFCGVGAICNTSRTLAEILTLGGLTKPDIPQTRTLILWGGNPFVSHEPFPPGEIGRIRRAGQKIIVVDPRRTETARKADIHLPIRPGFDEILILNMFHVVLREGLWDQPFTERWVHGFEEFHRTVVQDAFSPEKGESLTGIAPELVRTATHLYAGTKPAGIFTGNGLEHHQNGVRTARLIALLKAITGNLDIPGGELFTQRPPIRDITTPLPESTTPPLGARRFPLFCKVRKEANALCIPEAVLDERPYPIKGMIIAGGNASMEWPDSKRVREALNRLEFLMVIDVVASPDSRYADIVLPACTFLERDEHRMNVYQNLHVITLRRQVVPPLYGLPDQVIWMKLAQAMGFGEYFPWQDCREGLDELLGDVGITYEDLTSKGGIYEYEKRRYRKYESEGFGTPTGKVEIDSERLRSLGLDPFLLRKEPPTDPLPVEDAEYPLFLSTGGNLLCYLHWQYRYLPRLRKMAPDPVLEIHPETASECGLSENDLAEIRTSHGSIRIRAHLTSDIRPDTVHLPQGWEEANANELTGFEGRDLFSGFPNLKSLRCRIRRL